MKKQSVIQPYWVCKTSLEKQETHLELPGTEKSGTI